MCGQEVELGGGCAWINLLKLIQESRDKKKSGSVGGHKPMSDKIYGHVLFMRYTNAIEFIYLVTFNKTGAKVGELLPGARTIINWIEKGGLLQLRDKL